MSNEPDDRIVNQNDSAVFVGDCVPNYNITFHKNEEQIGVLDFNGPEMTFTGKADESAKVFFDFIADKFRGRLEDIEALQKQNATLLAIQAELVEALKHAAKCVQTNYLPDQCGHDWDEVIAKAVATSEKTK